MALTLTVELHPGDVVAHALHLPARQRGFHHGQVGLAAGTGEGSRHVALYALGVGDAEDLEGGQRAQWVTVGTGGGRSHAVQELGEVSQALRGGSLQDVQGGFTSAMFNPIDLLVLFAWKV